MTSTSRTALCGPACRVVWQGSINNVDRPYADSASRGIFLPLSRLNVPACSEKQQKPGFGAISHWCRRYFTVE